MNFFPNELHNIIQIVGFRKISCAEVYLQMMTRNYGYMTRKYEDEMIRNVNWNCETYREVLFSCFGKRKLCHLIIEYSHNFMVFTYLIYSAYELY